jgi:membrane protein YdbS with pleckstrin-like domain
MLIACTECGRQVSTAAAACPSCGHPVSRRSDEDTDPMIAISVTPSNPQPNPQSLLMEIRPSWWNFSWHLAVFLVAMPPLIMFVPREWWEIGWIVPAAWFVYSVLYTLYQRRSFEMRIYPDRVSIEEGFLAKDYSEFFIKDIRSIDVKQGVWQRLVNIGDVTISTAATLEASEEAQGIPGPNRIKDLLISRRQHSLG